MPTEWNAAAYRQVSALQEWLAGKSLAAVTLRGDEHVLDVGCGDGRLTAAIAGRPARTSFIRPVRPDPTCAGMPMERSPRAISFALATLTNSPIHRPQSWTLKLPCRAVAMRDENCAWLI